MLLTPNKEIPSLYFLKALCALMIIQIHFCSIYEIQRWFTPMIRTGVPIFLMISGFFIYSPDRHRVTEKTKKALWKTIRITLWTLLFFITLKLLFPSVKVINLEWTWAFWGRTLLFGSTVMGPLWYLTAYIETLAVFLLMLRWGKEKWMLRSFPLLIALCLMLGKYAYCFPLPQLPEDISKRNFLLIGIPFFSIGYLIRKYEKSLFAAVRSKLPLLLSGALLLAYAEPALLRPRSAGDIYIGTAPLAVSMFLFALAHPRFSHGSYAVTIGKKYALYIYILHNLVGYLTVLSIKQLFHIDITHYATLLIYLECLGLSILFCHARGWIKSCFAR